MSGMCIFATHGELNHLNSQYLYCCSTGYHLGSSRHHHRGCKPSVYYSISSQPTKMPRPGAIKIPPIFLKLFLPEFIGDGQSPIPTEVSRGYLYARSSLAALVFAPVYQTSDLYYCVTVKTHGYNLVNR